jgi:hypothetical protein
MNPSPQSILEQCREDGLCILTREQFETAFLFPDGPAEQNISRFCLKNSLELIVDAGARKFIFLAGQDGLWDTWCDRPGPLAG